MGAALGNPISEADQARINETIQDVIKIFSVEFLKSYTQAVIEELKNEKNPPVDVEDSLQLQKAPIPSHTLLSGMLTKRGDVNKNWLSRFFIAYNEEDNFKIEYYNGTSKSGQLKGVIYCAGYRAYDFNGDEVAEFGEKGIKLVPYNYRRRVWYIKCADDSLRQEWRAVFDNACYSAQPPRNKDECIATAFDEALKKLRWHYSIWGWYDLDGSEEERLATFILDLIDRDILNAVISNIAEGAIKSMSIDVINKAVGSSVRAACSSAWISSSSTVHNLSGSVKETASKALGPIIDKQKEMKERIVEKVGALVNPFLSSKVSSTLRPLLDIIMSPIADAFVLMVEGVHRHFLDKINSHEFSGAKFAASINQSTYIIDSWNGPLHKAYELIWKLHDKDLVKVSSFFSTAVTPYTVYCITREKLNILARRAIYTFSKLAADVQESKLGRPLNQVTAMLFEDSYVMVQATASEIFTALLDGPMQENVINPAGELVAPLQDVIDSIPLPGLSQLIDLGTLTEETIGDIKDNAIEAVLAVPLKSVKLKLDEAKVNLGTANITV